jgi:hypothetical protein
MKVLVCYNDNTNIEYCKTIRLTLPTSWLKLPTNRILKQFVQSYNLVFTCQLDVMNVYLAKCIATADDNNNNNTTSNDSDSIQYIPIPPDEPISIHMKEYIKIYVRHIVPSSPDSSSTLSSLHGDVDVVAHNGLGSTSFCSNPSLISNMMINTTATTSKDNSIDNLTISSNMEILEDIQKTEQQLHLVQQLSSSTNKNLGTSQLQSPLNIIQNCDDSSHGIGTPKNNTEDEMMKLQMNMKLKDNSVNVHGTHVSRDDSNVDNVSKFELRDDDDDDENPMKDDATTTNEDRTIRLRSTEEQKGCVDKVKYNTTTKDTTTTRTTTEYGGVESDAISVGSTKNLLPKEKLNDLSSNNSLTIPIASTRITCDDETDYDGDSTSISINTNGKALQRFRKISDWLGVQPELCDIAASKLQEELIEISSRTSNANRHDAKKELVKMKLGALLEDSYMTAIISKNINQRENTFVPAAAAAQQVNDKKNQQFLHENLECYEDTEGNIDFRVILM